MAPGNIYHGSASKVRCVWLAIYTVIEKRQYIPSSLFAGSRMAGMTCLQPSSEGPKRAPAKLVLTRMADQSLLLSELILVTWYRRSELYCPNWHA